MGELYTERIKIQIRLDKLMDLFIEGEIDKEDHDDKRTKLVSQCNKLAEEIR